MFRTMSMSTKLRHEIGTDPRAAHSKTVCRQGPKNGLDVQVDGARKMTRFTAKIAATSRFPCASSSAIITLKV